MSKEVTTKKEEKKAEGKSQKVRLICPKHGDVSGQALSLQVTEEGKPVQYLYCIPCLNEVLQSLLEAGSIEKIQVVPVEDEVEEVVPGLKLAKKK